VTGLWLIAVAVLSGQTQPVPRPFPRPGDPPPTQTPAQPSRPAPPPATPRGSSGGEPTQESLGLPVYPGAQFIVSYDAGRGQRYYLFGTNASFAEIVAYYKTYLKNGGDRVFDQPPTHTFEVGRFREETMAFPPGITVKDYTWGGSEGFLNPKLGAKPARFKTIIQIVPAPPGAKP
jgi:hypothetical protein